MSILFSIRSIVHSHKYSKKNVQLKVVKFIVSIIEGHVVYTDLRVVETHRTLEMFKIVTNQMKIILCITPLLSSIVFHCYPLRSSRIFRTNANARTGPNSKRIEYPIFTCLSVPNGLKQTACYALSIGNSMILANISVRLTRDLGFRNAWPFSVKMCAENRRM